MNIKTLVTKALAKTQQPKTCNDTPSPASPKYNPYTVIRDKALALASKNDVVKAADTQLDMLLSEYRNNVQQVQAGLTTVEVEPIKWLNTHKVKDSDMRIDFLVQTQNLELGIL